MDILILGNGFDLAHGLKTSYKHFIECCEKTDVEDMKRGLPFYKQCCRDNLWMKHFITNNKSIGDKWINLEYEIYKVINTLKDDPIITGSGEATRFCPQILSVKKRSNYFDFYNLKSFLNKPINGTTTNEKHCHCMNPNDCISFDVYINNGKEFIKFLYLQLREFTKAFENYLLTEVLSNIENESKFQLSLSNFPKTKAKNSELLVLSFNYTDTCERLYDSTINSLGEYRIKSFYVHGKATDNKDCNLVLGTYSFDNSYRPNTIANTIPIDFNVFKKHNQRHKYNTIESYQNLLSLVKMHQRKVKFHIIGHSLDKTDHNILKHLLQANDDSQINIYYHDEETQERLINKITEIIGEEEVMAKVRFINQHDAERGILIKQ